MDIQVGFERNEVGLIDVRGGTSRSAKEPDFSTAPVLKIMSPIKLGCVALRRAFNQGTSSQREGCIGFGGRFSGAQKRLEGRWFDLASDAGAEPDYRYRTDQIAGELLFGQLSEVSLAVGLGLRGGINNYDLQVSDGDRILFEENNKFSGFASWALYLDLQVLLSWPFAGFYTWPSDHFYLLYSYEETINGANTVTVPDINGAGEIPVEMKVRTNTITLELIF